MADWLGQKPPDGVFSELVVDFEALTFQDWPVTRMGVISDEFWAVVEPLMPSHGGKRGRRFGDHWLILEGIACRFRTGSPWRDLPAEFGPWKTVWKRSGNAIIAGHWMAPTMRCSPRWQRLNCPGKCRASDVGNEDAVMPKEQGSWKADVASV